VVLLIHSCWHALLMHTVQVEWLDHVSCSVAPPTHQDVLPGHGRMYQELQASELNVKAVCVRGLNPTTTAARSSSVMRVYNEIQDSHN
jgi:hypothetical protein